MKKISIWLFIFAFTVFMSSLARAQDDATQQQLDKLSGQIQDLQDAMAAQGKRIDALEKEINDLQSKSGQSGDAANPDDLKKLAAQVQEIDKKRQDDNEKILKELERLDKSLGVTPPSHKSTANTSTPVAGNTTAGAPQKGFEYQIAAGDTIAAIAKAYRAQGIKVTTDQILKANPGLNPNSLIVGKKIFIPAPQQ
ncbi:MAG TPA: LysM peptidoglycan-binding domain-containing protein [Verrucomicrobiae bacterium]|nr:LysM peptidoglycan-binding domain-containing protein [Verrucomicrobiae bacterium]